MVSVLTNTIINMLGPSGEPTTPSKNEQNKDPADVDQEQERKRPRDTEETDDDVLTLKDTLSAQKQMLADFVGGFRRRVEFGFKNTPGDMSLCVKVMKDVNDMAQEVQGLQTCVQLQARVTHLEESILKASEENEELKEQVTRLLEELDEGRDLNYRPARKQRRTENES